jgi:hypothetical protein
MLAAAVRDAGRPAEGGPVPAAAEPRRVRGDLVAPGDPGHAVAREQQQVQERRRDADQALDLPPARQLSWGPVGHGARL